MEYTTSPTGLKEAIPFTFKEGFVYHYNGIIPLEKAISSTMEELNFIQEDSHPSLKPPFNSINDIDNTWMLVLYLDPAWEERIVNYNRWQLDQFQLKENKRVKVELLTLIGHDSSYSFAWRIFEGSSPFDYPTYLNSFNVSCYSQLFNPFINGFRSWWKENQNVLCE